MTVSILQFSQLAIEEIPLQCFPRGIFWNCSCLPIAKYYGLLYCVSIDLKTIICKFQGTCTHTPNQCILISFIGNLLRSLECIVQYPEYHFFRSGIDHRVFCRTYISGKKSKWANLIRDGSLKMLLPS